MEHAFNFYFASNPLKRITASIAGVKQLYRYYNHIYTILSYPWLIHKEFPSAQIMIGGGAFTAFADQLIEKLPEGTIGILGEEQYVLSCCSTTYVLLACSCSCSPADSRSPSG